MIFKQTYRPGFMNVVTDSDKKVLCNKSGNPQSDKCPTMEFLFPFLEMNNCHTPVANRRKEGCNTLPFAWKTKNAQNAVFVQKKRMYYNVIRSNTKMALLYYKTCNTKNLVVSKKCFCNTTKTPNKEKVSVLQCNTM